MSVNLTINGQTFAYPEVGDTDWGTSATLWATAATNGMLQKAGGTFTLLADVNFGATFGIVSAYYKSTSSNISTAGSVRLAQADSIGWRNNANSGNLLLSVSSDALQFNGVNVLISGLIVNADISASAAIAFSKLAALTSGNILVGNVSNVAASVAVSGDITIDNAGVTAIGTGVIVNADVNASAAIAYSKLNLATSIVNADINGSAAIAYSKLNLATSIVNADINASAAIAGSKISPAFGNQVVSGDREFQFTEISTPGSPPGLNKVFLYPKADGNFYKMDDTGAEVQVGSGGSGSGSLNIVDNPSAISNTTGWTAATNYTVSRDTSNSPLAGVIDTCFAISTTTASTESSTSGVYAASLANPTALRNTKLQLSMYVTVPASSLGVWRVSVYNSGGTRVALSTDSSSVTTLPAGFTGQFSASFDADSGATYTLSITQTTRTSANTLYATNISIGNDQILQGSIVSEYSSYTPTFTGFGTVTGISIAYRRVGSNLHLIGRFTPGTTTAVEAQMTLPTGLTAAATTTNVVVGKYERRIATGSQVKQGTVLTAAGFAYIGFGQDDYTTAAAPETFRNGSSITATGEVMSFAGEVVIPIAEWAGSGTVNLASNGVEYVYNTTTTDASDTTAFGYGPNGNLVPNTLTASRAKRARCVTPIQITDNLSLEMNEAGTGDWIEVANNNGADVESLHYRNTTSYGAGLRRVSGSVTDIDIVFGQYASAFNAATYGAAGTAWSGPNGSGTRYRVKKTSSGQAVGFGVVSENASGLMPATNSSLDNAAATRLGLKAYAHGTTYNGGAAPTITLTGGGGTLSSIPFSAFIPYQMQDGSWRMRLNFTASLSSAARTSAQFGINGVTYLNSGTRHAMTGLNNQASAIGGAEGIAGASTTILYFASATITSCSISGDVPLDSKPTWAY